MTAEGGAELRLEVAGMRVELCFAPEHQALASEARRLWAPLVIEPTGEEPDAVLSVLTEPPSDRSEGTVTIRPGPSAAYSLSGQVTRRVISHLLGRRILLHAGVVEHRELGVVLLVGPSGAGKSTAVSVLGRGSRYLTDELAIIDPDDLTVTGYPKPVSRVRGGHEDRAKQDVALEDLELVPALVAGPPAHLVLLERESSGAGGVPLGGDDGARPHADVAEPLGGIERAGLGEALVRIAEQASSLWTVPSGLSRVAALLDGCGGALRVRYREAEQLAALLRERPPSRSEPWEVLVEGAPLEKALRVAPFVEAIGLMEEVVVLAPGRVVLLPGLTGVVWEELCVSGGMDRDELEAAVVAVIGPHSRSMELVDEALAVLISSDWVRDRSSRHP